MDIKAAILRGADVVDARKTFDPEERAKYLNASEALTCIRKQWYSRNGAAEDGPQNWGFARRGSHAENYMVDRLRAANVPMCFTGEDQVGLRDDERGLSCTPDGLVWDIDNDDGWIGVEFKSIDPRTNTSKLPKPEHVMQLQIGMAMLDEAKADLPEMLGAPIKFGKLIYINCSDFDTILEFPVRRADAAVDKLQARSRRLRNATDPSALPREGVETPFKAECKQRCNFNGVCGVDGAGTSTGQGRAAAGDITTQVSAYVEAKEKIAAAKAAQDQAGEQIKALLKREQVADLEVDGNQVTLSTRAGSVSYAKVVKAECPDVDLEPYRGAPSEVLTIKPRKL